MEFIEESGTRDSPSQDKKKRVRSHAARDAHARARQLAVRRRQAVQGADEATSSASAGEPSGQEVTEHVATVPTLLSGWDPFSSCARPMTDEEKFLFHHYVHVVIPYLDLNCFVLRKGHEWLVVRKDWVRFATSEVVLMEYLFLAACRHLSMVRVEEKYKQIATFYKVSCLQAVNTGIAARKFTNVLVAAALALAFDEIMLCDLTTAGRHVAGALTIIDHGGGPEALELSAFLKVWLYRFLEEKQLLKPEPRMACGKNFMQPQKAC